MDLTILSKKQIEILETLKKSILLNSPFYLAGGTGLALILAHRKSIDFDFFSKADFSPEKILEQLRKNIKENQISLAEMKEDTLIVFLKSVQAIFFLLQLSFNKALNPKKWFMCCFSRRYFCYESDVPYSTRTKKRFC